MFSHAARRYLYSNRRGQHGYVYCLESAMDAYESMKYLNTTDDLSLMDDDDDKINFVTRMKVDNDVKKQIISHIDSQNNVLSSTTCKKPIKKKTEVVNVS